MTSLILGILTIGDVFFLFSILVIWSATSDSVAGGSGTGDEH